MPESSLPLRLLAPALIGPLLFAIPAQGQGIPKGSTVVESTDRAWLLSFDSELRFVSWSGNIGFPNSAPAAGAGASGSQVYAPVAFALQWVPDEQWKHEVTLRGGYASSSQDAPTALAPSQIGSFGSVLDTTVGWRVTYTGIDGFVPFWALNMNLPTGRSVLIGPARFARLDPDIVDMPTYGQGFNVGQVFGANIPISANQLLTVSIGHTLNGSYLRDNYDFATLTDIVETFKPSDSYSANLDYAFQIDKVALTLGALAIFNGPSSVNNALFFQAGTTLGLTASAVIPWNDWSKLALNASVTSSERNWVQNGLGGLAAEAFNSNSTSLSLAGVQSFTADRWTFGFGANVLWRDRNSYDPVDVSYVSAKTKFGVEGSAGYKVGKKGRLTAKVEKFWVNQDATPARITPFAAAATPVYVTEGWKMSLGGTWEF